MQMREPGGPTQPEQTMEQIRDVLADGLGPEIPTELISGGERVRMSVPEGATYIKREEDGSIASGRRAVGRVGNGDAMTLDRGTQSVEVTQGPLGGRIGYSYNRSGTTDIVTLSATPEDVRKQVQQVPGHRAVQESTAQILATTEINGETITQIEDDFRRAAGEYRGDGANNRLGQKESLVRRLAEDNELVTGAGFTHRQLAEPLAAMFTEFSNGSRAPRQVVEYEGSSYSLEGDVARGLEFSALTGQQTTIMLIRVVNVETGASLQFDALSPREIGEHGFYGGTAPDVTRRVSPGAIATVFNMRPRNN